ncbi:hypothetical protein REPUB_Repub15cG0087700 [Reevesia pubescens]
MEDETVTHALWNCHFAAGVWRQLNFNWEIDHGNIVEASDWLKQAAEILNQQQLQQLAVTTWSIWNNRNGELHGHQRKTFLAVASLVNRYLEEFNMAIPIYMTQEK